MINDNSIFWFQDPLILFKNNNYINFIPTNKMTRIEQLNSLTLFCIYLLILLYITNKLTYVWIQLIVFFVIFIIIFYYIYINDNNGKLNNMTNIPKDVENMIIESGYYDTEGKLKIGRFLSHDANKNDNLNYTFDEYNKYQKNNCKNPTDDNPFMNPSILEYNNDTYTTPCNILDENIQDKITNLYNKDLYRDLNDLFDVKNSKRQFFTIPGGNIPHNQQSFAEWLYKSPPTCKEDAHNCCTRNDYIIRNI